MLDWRAIIVPFPLGNTHRGLPPQAGRPALWFPLQPLSSTPQGHPVPGSFQQTRSLPAMLKVMFSPQSPAWEETPTAPFLLASSEQAWALEGLQQRPGSPLGGKSWKGQECAVTDQTSCLGWPLIFRNYSFRKWLAPHLENGDNEPQHLGAIEGVIDSWWWHAWESWPGIQRRLLSTR